MKNDPIAEPWRVALGLAHPCRVCGADVGAPCTRVASVVKHGKKSEVVFHDPRKGPRLPVPHRSRAL